MYFDKGFLLTVSALLLGLTSFISHAAGLEREHWQISASRQCDVESVNVHLPGPNNTSKSFSPTVPEAVFVSWNKLPRKGQKRYEGDPVGPYRIKLRSRIPPDVLTLSRHDDYQLAISLNVGREPILLCWELWDFADGYDGERHSKGGDCYSWRWLWGRVSCARHFF